MNKSNIRNVNPAPAIPIKLSPRNAENVERYTPKRLEEHVLFRFQPTHAIKVRKDDYSPEQIKKLEKWWSELNIDIRDSPFVNDPLGTVIIWTFCGGDDADPDNGVYGDDCE
jgi:hypothetical protein